jgi:hypothetical protein
MARCAALLFLALISQVASLSAQEEGEYYWEEPRQLSEGRGRFLSTLPVPGGFVAIWQESTLSESQEGGRAWLSLARLSDGKWESLRRFAGPFEFRGIEPILYSAAGAADGRIALAVADGGVAGKGSVELLLSSDGGRSFAQAAELVSEVSSVAPRVYASASGGWILFAAQSGYASGATANGAAEQQVQAGSLPIYVSSSGDGRDWTAFQPLLLPDESFGLAFLPAAAPLTGTTTASFRETPTDIVVFQALTGGERPSWQLYAKTSLDGGRTWSRARRVTDFQDPVRRDKPAPENFDNQRPSLGIVSGRLWMAWERNVRGASSQIYMAYFNDSGSLAPGSADMISSGAGACSDPQVLDLGGQPAGLWFDNRKGAGRVYLARRKDAGWNEFDLSGSSGEASFGRAEPVGSALYALWQSSSGGGDRILVREPDTHVEPPRLAGADFVPGKRSRSEKATIEVSMPRDPSGIAGYSFAWSRDPAAIPPRHLAALTSQTRIAQEATEDGPWYFSAIVQDFAGNWSAPARIRYDRKRRPPPPPIITRPDTDERGFLASNTFSVTWLPPEGEEAAGYTWDLRYAGPLQTTASEAAFKISAAARLPLPGLSSYEALMVERAGPPTPPPKILGIQPRAAWDDVDDGYYVFSVAAIDDVGNVSDTSSILLKANKYVPYTAVTFVDAARDDMGRTSLKILGRGFLAGGAVTKVVLDRDGREPYDIERSRGEFTTSSDRLIEGFSFEDAEAGSYRVGLLHPARGWFWTQPVIAVEAGGTVKYGLASPLTPLLRPIAPRAYRFSIYDAFVFGAVLFAALGILLSLSQAMSAVRDGHAVRLQVLALVRGGPMPSAEKRLAVRRLKRRGAGLRVKFTLTIASLVILVVLLVAIFLSIYVIRTESRALASSLQQRAYVLLESVAQGARSYLPGKDRLQLGFLPQQARAMEDAAYITLTGYGEGTTEPDAVWATNDKGIAGKIDGERLTIGSSRIVQDALAKDLPRIASELDSRAATEVSDINTTIADLTQEGRSLATKLDEPSKRRFDEIAQTLASLQTSLDEKLFALSSASIGSVPAFDPSHISLRSERYLFYKPVLYRSGSDKLYYRGMVRLEVSTELIVAEVKKARADLIKMTLAIAAIALVVGIAGAFVLSTVIVVPIRKLVRQIENIRDTEDKEQLEGSRIEVASRDELYTLADTVNQMTEGLVHAAKASKELIVGKGIQKMFIPLDTGTGTKAKLSTGKRDESGFEVYGYYEGAKGVSGDYWDFKSINARYHYFIKCDISGKGVSAALIMVEVATMVINYFNEWKKTMPKRIDLTDIAYQINDFIEERGYEGKRFAAFTIGVWDSQEGVAYLCEAGDRKLHVWDARSVRLVEELLPDSPAAGIFPSFMVQMKTPFAQVTRSLGPGDILLLYTDGIEEAKRHFRDAQYRIVPCTDVPKDESHENHSGGQDGEEFGYDRITSILAAVDSRGSYRLEKHHNPAGGEILSFDFSSCQGNLEEKIMALIAVEKVFRLYRDPAATAKDSVLVDEKVDAFLKAHFDQYRLYCSDVRPNPDPQSDNPGYLLYGGIKEDEQYDDLTILGIRRK